MFKKVHNKKFFYFFLCNIHFFFAMIEEKHGKKNLECKQIPLVKKKFVSKELFSNTFHSNFLFFLFGPSNDCLFSVRKQTDHSLVDYKYVVQQFQKKNGNIESFEPSIIKLPIGEVVKKRSINWDYQNDAGRYKKAYNLKKHVIVIFDNCIFFLNKKNINNSKILLKKTDNRLIDCVYLSKKKLLLILLRNVENNRYNLLFFSTSMMKNGRNKIIRCIENIFNDMFIIVSKMIPYSKSKILFHGRNGGLLYDIFHMSENHAYASLFYKNDQYDFHAKDKKGFCQEPLLSNNRKFLFVPYYYNTNYNIKSDDKYYMFRKDSHNFFSIQSSQVTNNITNQPWHIQDINFFKKNIFNLFCNKKFSEINLHYIHPFTNSSTCHLFSINTIKSMLYDKRFTFGIFLQMINNQGRLDYIIVKGIEELVSSWYLESFQEKKDVIILFGHEMVSENQVEHVIILNKGVLDQRAAENRNKLKDNEANLFTIDIKEHIKEIINQSSEYALNSNTYSDGSKEKIIKDKKSFNSLFDLMSNNIEQINKNNLKKRLYWSGRAALGAVFVLGAVFLAKIYKKKHT